MRTRRKSADEKREAEEQIRKVQDEKMNKKKHKRRKLIGRYDLPVDRHLPKIYIDPAEIGEPVEVKVEIKTESNESENDYVAVERDCENLQGNEYIEDEGSFFVEEEVFILEDLIAEKVLPFVLPILEQQNVFKCRGVNKQWRNIVDAFIENAVVPKPYDDKAYLETMKNSPNQLVPLPGFSNVKRAYKLETETDLIKFNKTMKGHTDSGSSPFVGGATILLKETSTESPELSKATKTFLEKFGVYIHRLEVQAKQIELGDSVDIVRFVNYVKRCLRFVPNVEKLKVIGNCWHKDVVKDLAEAKMNVYRSEIMDRTPKLEKLTSMEFEYFEREKATTTGSSYSYRWHFQPYVQYLEEIFRDIMIKADYQRQLKQLSLHRIHKLFDFRVETLNQLTLIDLECDLGEIGCQFPVKKLTLLEGFSSEEDSKNVIPLEKIFPRLQYPCVDRKSLIDCLEVSTWDQIQVHTLEIVEFSIEKGVPQLNKSFPHLRHLIIRHPGDEYKKRDIEKADRIQLNHLFYGGKTYSTNLWESLIILEVFTLQFQNHAGLTGNPEAEGCCECLEGQNTECLYQNIVETRQDYITYKERIIGTAAK